MEVVEGLGEDGVSVSSRTEILDELARTLDQGERILVFVAKLDRLKAFNHAHGVEKGDQFLAAVGHRITQLVGGTRRVGALRSDIFMALVEPGDATPQVQIEQTAARLTRPLSIDGLSVAPELKIGVAISDPGRSNVDDLLIEASAAMRAALASRETVIVADDGIRNTAHVDAIVERDVEAAMAADTMAFHYQPVVTLHDGVVHGAEALLRWHHPELGVLDPTVVIRRIEALGLTDMFTQWSLNRVASEWAEVVSPDASLQGMSVSLNLCESQLANPLCVPWMQRALADHGLDPQSVILEVVESGPVGVGEAAAKTLQALASDGCLIVLDDFGTGFNALEYFLKFPIHGLKFDRTLISSMVANATARTIVSGVARIADDLDVVTVAEGLETTAEVSLCRDVPLTLGQGWHFGHPDTLNEFAATARRSRLGKDQAAIDRQRLSQRATPDPQVNT